MISSATFEAYEKYTANIVNYLKESKQLKKYIDDIDESWLTSFKYWGQGKFSVNYLGKHLYYLKSLVDYALLKKVVKSNPIKPYKVDKDEPDPDDLVFLYTDELARLQAFDFSALPVKPERAARLARIRDAYIFMQQIGTHFGEYKKFVQDPTKYLRIVNGVPFIRMKRNKTKKYMLAPVTSICYSLADKYGGFNKLPVGSLTQFNDGLQLISAYLGFGKELTTKSARKTFADHAMNENVTDDDTTARMMGLSSTVYLKHYGRIDERRIIKALNLKPLSEDKI